jgi:type VI secretion system secreted protein VgrG
LAVATPLGTDVLLLERLAGSDGLSRLFRLQLDLLGEATSSVAFDKILGESVTITMMLDDGTSRYFNGIVNRFSAGPERRGVMGDHTFRRYRAEVVPKLWLLTRSARSRIFQQIAVPDILKTVLTGIDVSWQIQGTFDTRDYCVQYRETDFDFASRLMEEEGIYYYFTHANGSHKMVVANTPQSHAAVPGPTSLIYETVEGGTRPEDRIHGWEKTQEVRSGKVRLWDSCFELPNQNLEAVQPTLDSVAAGTVTHKLGLSVNNSLELYDWPGAYAQRYDGVAPGGGDRADDVQKIFKDNARTAGIRMQQEATPAVAIDGVSTCRNLTAGHKFTLQRHPDANGDYVLTEVTHECSMGGVYTGEFGSEFTYSNLFRCLPAALPYRPLRVTPRAHVWGTHTAVVVGPPNEEIFTDKYGRIKVQFFWDRDGKHDANSSCWVRVGTHWAGQQWGAIHIPRIGQEVVVAFEEGDPDRPIVVGSVYNADMMPPYTLPDSKTQSGIKSRSSLKGTADNYNEIRFEDKKDSELITIHAEKDFDRYVENNDTLKVGYDKKDKGDQSIDIFNNQTTKIGGGASKCDDGSQSIDVFNNQTVKIGSGEGNNKDGSQTLTVYKDRTATVETGNETLTVKKGNRTVTISTGNDTHQIDKGNRDVEIALGNDTLTIKTGNQTVKLNAGASSTEAMQSITLKVGPSSIKIDPSGITLQGVQIKVQGTAQVQVQAPMIQISADGMLVAKGGLVKIN